MSSTKTSPPKKESLPRLLKHLSSLFFSFVKTDFANSFQPQPRCRYYSNCVKKLRRNRDYAKICYFFCVCLCVSVCVCFFCAYSSTFSYKGELHFLTIELYFFADSHHHAEMDYVFLFPFCCFPFVIENVSVWFWKNRSLMFTSALQQKY